MRPLHALVLLLVLSGALVAGLLFLGGGDRKDASPGTTAHAGAEDAGAPAPAAALDAPEAGVEAPGRAAHQGDVAVGVQPASIVPAAGGSAIGLHGRVVDPFGKPVASATVFAAAGDGFDEIPLDAVDPQAMPWFRRADAKTDAEGRFTIRPDARGKVRLAVRAAGFAPHDATLAPPGAEKDLGDIALEASAVLIGRVLDASGRPVAGAELRRQGLEGPAFAIMSFGSGTPLATTDARGAFRVDQLSAGPWKILITSEDHPDKTESGETESPGTVVAGLEFVLEEGFEIQGRVTGAPEGTSSKLSVRATPRQAGEEGAVVVVEPFGGGGGGGFGAGRRARVGADGSFTVRGCKRGASYRLVAREGDRDFFGRVRTSAVQARAGDRGVALPYRPETALVFQVVDATSGAPVTDMSVQAGWRWKMPLMGDDGRPVQRFPDGRVRFGSLPAKPQREAPGGGAGGPTSTGLSLRIEAAGYRAYERTDLAPVDGQDQDLGVIRLERAPVVRVVVLDDASGKPVAGASVSLVEEETRASFGAPRMVFTIDDDEEDTPFFGGGAAQRGRTDAEGRASLTSLPGKTATLRVRHKGHAEHRSDPIALPASEDMDQVVHLKAGGTVIVEVVDPSGAAVPGAAVDHEGPDGESAGFRFGGRGDDLTDGEGRLELVHLAPGAHRFRLRDGANGAMAVGGRRMVRRMSRAGGGEEGDEGWSQVVVAEGSVETLRLVAPARCSLAGKITEAGKPLANALVRLDEEGGDAMPRIAGFAGMGGGPETRTNSRGEYSLDGVPVGEWRVSVSHATRAMSYEGGTTLREGGNELDLDLPLAIVEGKIVGPDRKPIAGARVRAERATPAGERRQMVTYGVMVRADGGEEPEVSFGAGDSGPTVLTDADGKYTLRGVLPDVEIVVKASGKDLQPGQSPPFHVAPDQVKGGVDLVLQTGGTIEATVTRAAGGAATGCMVRAEPEGEAPGSSEPSEPKVQITGQNGVARLTGMKPGKWRVSVDLIGPFAGDQDAAEIPDQIVEVKAGETAKPRFEAP